MKAMKLPAAYKPFSKLRIGGNLFENAQALVTIGGRAPLLIGQGETLRVWLSGPDKEAGNDWFSFVSNGVSSLDYLKIKSFKRIVTVTTENTVLLRAVRSDADILTVQALDLRILGLDIFLDKSKVLHVVGSTLSKAEFHGMPVVMVCPALS